MSWRYSTSYAPRDHSSSRDSSQLKYGLASSGDKQSKWLSNISGDSRLYRNSIEPLEHSPVWAKTSQGDNSASVQRLKERYGGSEENKREARQVKRAETKDFCSPTSRRPYGRSLTLNIGETGGESGTGQSAFRKLLEKAPEAEKSPGAKSPLDNRKVLYMPTATTKLLTRKYSSELSPTTIGALSRFPKSEVNECDGDQITVVTRGTSPTPTTSTLYLRSKRSDYGLEKKVPRRRRPVQTAHKEVQTEREEISLSKYGTYSESAGRTKPWTSYADKYSSCSYGSKFCGRSSYASECRRDQGCGLSPGEYKRSVSREDPDSPATPESPHKSLAAKPPASAKTPPMSPVKDSEKKSFHRKSPPGNIRSSLKLDCAKAELARNPNSPTHLPSPLQCKIVSTETLQNMSKFAGHQSPKVTIDSCPEVGHTIDDDVSSLSESSEEETSSEEDADAEPLAPAMVVKKSVTNFLQNIPNHLPQNQSRTNLCNKFYTLSPPKFNFTRIESGEKAWWLEAGDKTAEGGKVTEAPDAKPHVYNNLLSPPYLINRQFSTDRDWLKGSTDDIRKVAEKSPIREEIQKCPKELDGVQMNGETLNKPHNFGNSNRRGENGEENFDVTPSLRRRDLCSISPENFLEDPSHQMKFNQQTEDEKKFLADFPRECSVKDISQKLQNGLGSPLEDKNFLEPGDMSGMISKAKAGLAKSKTKLDIKKSSSREMSPKIMDTKSEIDLYWKELADSLSRPLRLCDLDFTDLNSDDETDILGNHKTNGEVPPPPPPMLILPVPALSFPKNSVGNVPPIPPTTAGQAPPGPRLSRAPAPPPILQIAKNKKTVKLFWKEVKDEPVIRKKDAEGAALIWDELAQVKVDTQKLEYLFESRAKDLMSKKQQEQNKNKEVIVLDPKRSNAINIGMTKLPPPRAIKTAILKMDSTVVTKEGIEKLLSMLPTEEETLRIQEAQNANPDVPLGSAEQFLLTLASISELEARLRLWAFKLDFENSEKEICEPLMDLKQGMEILRANRTFRGILGTLLSIGNFLNGYDVRGFQIEYLSKVPEVKDTVHKHSLLHHLCIIVMEKFPESTDLYSEIGAVTRASKVDFDELASNIKKVEEECKLSWNYLKMIAKHEGHTAMKVKMSDFLADCAERIIVLGTVHKRVVSRFQKFAFWLGVPMNRISTTRPNEIFKIISEFALEYRTTRDRILQQIKKMNREKSRTRGFLSNDPNDMVTRKINSKEAKDDARLKQLLENEATYPENLYNSTWRRQRKDTKNLLQDTNKNDEEILETLIKTANQVPSSRATLKERRRSRVYGKCCE